MSRFHSKAPKIRGIFHQGVKDAVDNYGFLASPHGRRRDFFARRTKQFYKEVYSYLPQAIVSDHTKLTIPLVLNEIPEAYVIAEKHDAFLAEVPIALKEKYVESFKRHMERSISFRTGSIYRDFDLVIPSEIKYSLESWGKMEKVKI